MPLDPNLDARDEGGGTVTATQPDSREVRRPTGAYLAIAAAAVFLVLGAVLATGSGDDDGAAAGAGLAGTVLAEPWERPSFTLTSTDGSPFDFRTETAGRTTLLFFGYTSCPDICPVHLATLAGALENPQVPDPVVVFVGVDPARDTPEAVRAYLDQFDSDFIGLVGTPEELEAAQRLTGVAVADVGEPDADGDYLVGHASQIVAYTPDDLAHVVYPFGARRQDWVNDLPRLARIDWTEHGH